MYVEPWIFWLTLAPIAAGMALYLGYIMVLLVTLGGMHVILGASKLGETLSAGLHRQILSPFRHLGPWFDYAVVAGILIALCAVFALLA